MTAMTLTDGFATTGIALAVLAVLVSWANALCAWRRARVVPHYLQIVVALGALFALLVPVIGLISPAALVRGISSDLSITLVVLSVWSLCCRFGYIKPIDKREFAALMATVAAAALVLYPTALGWGDWDAYRSGWGSWWLLATMLTVCGASASMGLRLLPALVALALLAWSAGLMESSNLWDYLLDPWLSGFALGFVFIKCWRAARRRLQLLSSSSSSSSSS